MVSSRTLGLLAFALVIRGVLQGGSSGRLWSLAGVFKFLVLVFLAWLVLKQGLAGGMSLVAGYAALPMGISKRSRVVQ